MVAVLGAPERRRLARRARAAEPEPEPAPVTTGRATVIELAHPLPDEPAAKSWLEGAGEDDLAAGLAVLNRALHGFRLVTADPHLQPVGRGQLLVARIGYGAGEQVAEGQWSAARELLYKGERQTRAKILQPQARLAALLSGREQALACEELVLRVRLDLDSGREREAALGLLVALDSALAELSLDPGQNALAERLAELRAQRDPVAAAAQAALSGPIGERRENVAFTLARIEAALRARAVANE